MSRDVFVVVGVGGMGLAIARRCGAGRHLLLADRNPAVLTSAAAALAGDGHTVTSQEVDVTDRASIAALADEAARLGVVRHVVHTAGVSSGLATAAAIIDVDLLGVAYSLEEFARVIAPGGSGVVIASMAGQMGGSLGADIEAELSLTPAAGLPSLASVEAARQLDPEAAYCFAKRANQVRVGAASIGWGAREARINVISPGIIATPMGNAELAGPAGGLMRRMIELSAAKRVGTPEDVADAAAFLLGETASFITGADLLVDGGVIGAFRAGEIDLTDRSGS